MTTCSLCGSEFDEETAHKACQGCGFLKGCDLAKCPRCGFENVPEPRWIKNLFRRDEKQEKIGTSEACIQLNELDVNQRAKVSFVRMENRSALQKMIALGVLPETELVLLQKFPSFVFQIGFSQFSVDEELASCIYVKPTLENSTDVRDNLNRENTGRNL